MLLCIHTGEKNVDDRQSCFYTLTILNPNYKPNAQNPNPNVQTQTLTLTLQYSNSNSNPNPIAQTQSLTLTLMFIKVVCNRCLLYNMIIQVEKNISNHYDIQWSNKFTNHLKRGLLHDQYVLSADTLDLSVLTQHMIMVL